MTDEQKRLAKLKRSQIRDLEALIGTTQNMKYIERINKRIEELIDEVLELEEGS